MSDRLSDDELDRLDELERAATSGEMREWGVFNGLIQRSLRPLLEEVREYRSLRSMIVDDTRAYRGIVPGDVLRGLIERDQRIEELEATTVGNIQDFAADMQAQDREVIAALEERIEELEAGLAAERALSARRARLADSWCDEAARKNARIAELEEDRDFWQERALESERGGGAAGNSTVEHHRKRTQMLADRIDAREAQLANLRRTIESWADRGMVLVSDVLAELDEVDEVDIPTDLPEAEDMHTRRIATLEWREASPPPPAVDPREEEDA